MAREIIPQRKVQVAERLPSSIMGLPTINTQIPPGKLRGLLNEQGELDTHRLGVFFVGRTRDRFASSEDTPHRLVPPSSHRGLLVRLYSDEVFGQFPMAIIGKGNGLPATSLIPRSNLREWAATPDRIKARLAWKHDANGLFGSISAQWDWEISNFLAGEGARVSIPIGTIPIDRQGLEEWGMTRVTGAQSPYPLSAELAKIDRKGQEYPVLYYRFGDDVRISDMGSLEESGLYSKRSVMARAASSYVGEINLLGSEDSFFARYGMQKIPNFSDHMKQIIAGELTPDTVTSYACAVAAIVGYNYGVWARVGSKIAKQKLGYEIMSINHYAHYQDIGITGRQHDFEVQPVQTKFERAVAFLERRHAPNTAVTRGLNSAARIYRAILSSTLDVKTRTTFAQFAADGFSSGFSAT